MGMKQSNPSPEEVYQKIQEGRNGRLQERGHNSSAPLNFRPPTPPSPPPPKWAVPVNKEK